MAGIVQNLYNSSELKPRHVSKREQELVSLIKEKFKKEYEELEEIQNNSIGDVLFSAYKHGFRDNITLNRELQEGSTD